MDWKREAINDLSQLRRRENAQMAIPEQIAVLHEDFVSLRGAGAVCRCKAAGHTMKITC